MSDIAESLAAPLHEKGSGLARYAAAMSLYQSGLISAETLEVYRACSPDDSLDPLAELARLGMTHDLSGLQLLLT